MTSARLLAKSSATPDHPRREETLPGHTGAVVAAARALADIVGQRSLEALRLSPAFRVDQLRRVLETAAMLHDLGKANSHFQAAVRHPGTPQALRHEWVSAWLALKFGDTLLAGLADEQRVAVLCAVAGHHLELRDAAAITARPAGDTAIRVFAAHPDLRDCFGVASSLPGRDFDLDLTDRPLSELREWLGHADAPSGDAARFTSLLKALLICADVAGSALPRRGVSPDTWLADVLARVGTEEDFVHIARERLAGKGERPFQTAVAATTSRVTFVSAGCGSGKTVAAYLWAARHATGRKLFICYPTTGTATEGFGDYVASAGLSHEAELIHSRSEVDIELLLPNLAEDEDEPRRLAKVESLRALDAPLVVCTADLVLGVIRNNRRPLFSFPALANGAFVFDEVHQYNDDMFGALLRFLGAFRGVPVLLMTASLPAARRDALRDELAKGGETLQMVPGPAGIEGIPRYELAHPQREAPWPEVASTLSRRGKVLWVANTVDRAASFWHEARAQGFDALIYHSRFRYKDRVAKHKAVMEAFRTHAPKLAVTTQVCEVSLDISADLLVTDLAPVPALIQRLGRLNRRVQPGQDNPVCRACFIMPDGAWPYGRDELDLDAVAGWVAALAGRPISQEDLAAAFEQDSGTAPGRIYSEWLDSVLFSYPGSLRGPEATFPVVLHADRSACLDGKGRPIAGKVTELSIPMPLGNVGKEVINWRRAGYAFVPPPGRIEYSTEWGGKWVKQT